jgi:diguanylate cyclase (GGDEF)-like protein
MPVPNASDLIYDALTGVYSRQMLRQWLPEGIENAQRHDYPLALMMLDIDYFKSVNDAFGHARGDQTLVDFAQRVQSLLRASDMVFRYGGDEFVVLSPRAKQSQAKELATRLVQAIHATKFGSEPALSVTVSLGIAIYPDDGLTPEAIFETADQRHYLAKRNGRGRVISESPAQSKPLLFVEPSRLIEQDEALITYNHFLNTIPAQAHGALRVSGPAGAGHSRFLAEARKIARLRGFAILALQGRPALKTRSFSVLLEALQDNPLKPSQHKLPTLVSSSSGEQFIASLRNWIGEKGNIGLLITLDDIPQIDRGSMSFLRDLYFYPDLPRLCLIYTDGGANTHLGFPWDIPIQETTHLRALSQEGVQVWVRQALQWEAPRYFLEWLYKQTGGLPGELKRGMTLLTRQGLLKPGVAGWEIATETTEMQLRGLWERQTRAYTMNLPGELMDFVGREDEIARLKQMLKVHRLILLYGAGGVGKTCLAMQTAAECSEQFADGTCYVSLANVKTSEWLISTIADALHYTFFGPREPSKLLLAYLRNKEMLLVLDNFEHIPDGVGVITEILEQAPGIRLMVTTRERLDLPGEAVFNLTGLPVPDTGQRESLESSAAVQLFINSAQRYQPDFSLAAEDWAAVAQICRMVDGVPLSIEMAASWTQSYRPTEIAAEISSSLSELVNGQFTVPEQYRRLKATFDSLWNIFSASEQATLCRLSILPGEFSSEAARKIADASLFFLEALVSRSILHRNQRDRYTMQALLRQYFTGKLEQLPGMPNETVESFCAYYLGLVESQQEKLPRDGKTLDLLKRESDNLRIAWNQAIAHGMVGWIKRAALPLGQFYRLTNLWSEGELAYEAVIAWAEQNLRKNDQPEFQQALGNILAAQVGLLNNRANFARAAEVAPEALKVAQQCENLPAQTVVYQEWGVACWYQNDYSQARKLLNKAFDLSHANHLVNIETDSLHSLGLVSFSEHNFPEALSYLERSLALSRQAGNQRGEVAALKSIGTVYLNWGDTQQARTCYQEARQLAISLGDQRTEGRLVNNLGCAYQSEGDNYRALTCFEQVLRVEYDYGDRGWITGTMTNLGISYHRLGELDRARAAYEQAIQVCGEIGHWEGGAGGISNLGLICYHQGNYEVACQYQLQCARVAQDHMDTHLLSYPLLRLGQVYLAFNRYPEAEQCCKDALQYRLAAGRPDLTLDPLACLARLSQAQGDLPQALNYCEQLLEQCQGVIHDDDTDDPFWIYLTLFQVFDAAQDARGAKYLHTACAELRKRAAAIPDLDIRISFLENLPSNRLIDQTCQDDCG